MNTEQAILIKIKKLMEMEKSAREIGNPHEAAAFGARVQQMLRSYKLEMAEVQDIELNMDEKIEVDREIFGWDEAGIEASKHRNHWLESLTVYVCEYNNCKMHGIRNSNMVAIIGTESSRAVVTWLLVTLSRYGKEAMEESYRKEYYKAKKTGDTDEVKAMKGYRRSFVTAYVRTIALRMKEQFDADNAKACTERGLMVLNKEKQAVEDFMSTLNLQPSTRFRGCRNYAGYQDGTEAGKKASVSCNGVNSSHKNKLTHA